MHAMLNVGSHRRIHGAHGHFLCGKRWSPPNTHTVTREEAVPRTGWITWWSSIVNCLSVTASVCALLIMLVCPSFCLCVCLSVFLSVCQSFCSTVCLLHICLSVCLSHICLSVCQKRPIILMSVHLSVCLFAHLPLSCLCVYACPFVWCLVCSRTTCHVSVPTNAVIAKALTLKNDGNEHFKKKQYDKAVKVYTEALKLKCSDDELNTMLYTNRAAANFYLGNNRSSLEDAKEALRLNPSHMKAIVRGTYLGSNTISLTLIILLLISLYYFTLLLANRMCCSWDTIRYTSKLVPQGIWYSTSWVWTSRVLHELSIALGQQFERSCQNRDHWRAVTVVMFAVFLVISKLWWYD